MADTPAEGDTGTGTGTPAATGAWYASLDADTQGYLQNRGLLEKTSTEVAVAAIASHRAAEAKLGIPAADILRKPKDVADEANWQALREFLGVPKDGAYDLKVEADKITPADADWLKAVANKLRLPADAAPELAAEFLKRNADQEAATLASRTAASLEGQKALRENWGANYEANTVIAKSAFDAVLKEAGLPPESYAKALTALENMDGVGYKGLMEVFRTIGVKMGEDRHITPSSGNGLLTRDGASSRLSDLKNDTAWTQRLMDGDVTARKEFDQLSAILAAD